MNNYDRAMSERFFLVNENGPTKLTIVDEFIVCIVIMFLINKYKT